MAAMPLTPETLLIPNTVAIVRGAPHAAEAEQMFQFIQRPEVAERLVKEAALESAQAGQSQGLQVDWKILLADLDAATGTMKEIFLRRE